ncbi:hypothetical protein [Thalassobacillus hwangdonensis]|uniref:Uncharacterized protein n=1 Tax=Thalassobacillus hwangdonensis TaxID=546108 RepID=A0ABW3KZC1_9BACI
MEKHPKQQLQNAEQEEEISAMINESYQSGVIGAELNDHNQKKDRRRKDR